MVNQGIAAARVHSSGCGSLRRRVGPRSLRAPPLRGLSRRGRKPYAAAVHTDRDPGLDGLHIGGPAACVEVAGRFRCAGRIGRIDGPPIGGAAIVEQGLGPGGTGQGAQGVAGDRKEQAAGIVDRTAVERRQQHRGGRGGSSISIAPAVVLAIPSRPKAPAAAGALRRSIFEAVSNVRSPGAIGPDRPGGFSLFNCTQQYVTESACT